MSISSTAIVPNHERPRSKVRAQAQDNVTSKGISHEQTDHARSRPERI
jgi:hypothetical protein